MGDGTRKSTVQSGDDESGANMLGLKKLVVGAIVAMLGVVGLLV